MSDRPTLHLTNWASRSQHGPGRRLCAMARPRSWEHGDGMVPMLAPHMLDLDAWRAGRLTLAEYRERYLWRLDDMQEGCLLGPGALALALVDDDYEGVGHHPAREVRDGDSLLCSCPRPDSPRRTHPCHLEWLAPYLVRAGWRVILYGEEVTSE